MTESKISYYRPFNIPLETGLRMLFILERTAPIFCDIQRLVYYDYLLIHSGDVSDGPPSLHPPIPHRSGEWLVRRNLIISGLDLMFAKELVEKKFDDNGITYGVSDLTTPFLNYLTSNYAITLRSYSNWVAKTFETYSDKSLTAFMVNHLGKWGAEFKQESLVRGLPI